MQRLSVSWEMERAARCRADDQSFNGGSMIALAITFFFCLAAVFSYARNPGGVRSATAVGDFAEVARGGSSLPWRIVTVAFGLRLLVGLMLYFYGWNAFLAPDVMTYAQGGIQIAQWWMAIQHVDVAPFIGDDQARYLLVNALVYYALGYVPWLLLFATSAAGAWTVLLAWRVAHRLSGDAIVARNAALLVAFFPSLVLWSSVNLRDPFLVLAVMGVAWATIRLKEQWDVQAVLALILWSLLIGTFREYVLLLIGGGVIAAAIIGDRRNLGWNLLLGTALLAGMAALILSTGLGTEAISTTSLDYVNQMRFGLTIGAGSAFAEGDTSTLSATIRYLPVGLLYFLYAPFPWVAQGTLQFLTVPEMLIWYGLMWKILGGVRNSFARNPSAAWAVTAFILVLAIGYGMVSGNAGTAYRHRAQVLPLFLVFAAAGWAKKSPRPESGGDPSRSQSVLSASSP
jgi:hypothetical protein